MNKQPHICVVGSINMDLVTKIDRMPDQGETVLGGKFETHPGGKGANQAVAAARLGSKVTMIGAVGNDSFGEKMLTHLEEEKVLKEAIHVDANKSTGIASIIVSENDNRIIVSSGANEAVTPELVEHLKEEILASDMVLLQFEIPMETIVYVVNFAYDNQIPVILNPAPYQDIPEETLAKVTYITPNEIEYDALKSLDSFEAIKNKMIITKGKQGIEFIDESGEKNLCQPMT
ncbi:ribokinase [Paraliobacillus salinarum]|uniref:ribokinase n=1 Tax=Paraliobacillus salinarum TaxID=1158996 RepID=UPI0031B638E0